jgi:SPP1 gp7 family putative phage head morphogenesis protein
MIFEIQFKTFMDMYKKDKQFRACDLYYKENKDNFELYFQSHNHMAHKTTVKRSTIEAFGESYGADATDAVEDWKADYLNEAIELEVEEKEIETVYFSKNVDADFVIDESTPYDNLYTSIVDQWEEKVIANIPKLQKMQKGFGDFISSVFNTINTKSFLTVLRRTIKNSVLDGVSQVEEEQNTQVGFTFGMSERVKVLENQQLNGYRLPDGKAWPGIKGQTKELQFNILKSVEEAIKNKESNESIAARLRGDFNLSKVSAERTARTETTRFINEGKSASYKEIGIDGKICEAVGDNKTSELCTRLWDKYKDSPIALDEPFIDDVTGKQFSTPPFHVNCRCVIGGRKL